MKISVVVCTYNRCEDLRRTLESLMLQDFPALDHEILVVDNNSTDRTKDVVSEFPCVRYLHEERVGLSHARNRGISESRGNIIAFIDDDARAEKSWLVNLAGVYRDWKDAQCVGGKVVLEWTAPKPAWWTEDMDIHVSAVDYGDKIKRLSYPLYPYGTNISFKKSVFYKLGIFNPELGRIGKRLLAGEEIDVCLNIEKTGGAIYYCPGMVVHHLAQPERLKKEFILRKSYWHGRSCALLERRHFGKRKVFNKARYMIRQILLSLVKIPRDVQSKSMIYYNLGYIRQWVQFRKG